MDAHDDDATNVTMSVLPDSKLQKHSMMSNKEFLDLVLLYCNRNVCRKSEEVFVAERAENPVWTTDDAFEIFGKEMWLPLSGKQCIVSNFKDGTNPYGKSEEQAKAHIPLDHPELGEYTVLVRNDHENEYEMTVSWSAMKIEGFGYVIQIKELSPILQNMLKDELVEQPTSWKGGAMQYSEPVTGETYLTILLNKKTGKEEEIYYNAEHTLYKPYSGPFPWQHTKNTSE